MSVVGCDIAYLGRIVECPSEVGIISERSLHTLYGFWDVGLGQWDDLDRHGICGATTVSITVTAGSASGFQYPGIASTGSAKGLR